MHGVVDPGCSSLVAFSSSQHAGSDLHVSLAQKSFFLLPTLFLLGGLHKTDQGAKGGRAQEAEGCVGACREREGRPRRSVIKETGKRKAQERCFLTFLVLLPTPACPPSSSPQLSSRRCVVAGNPCPAQCRAGFLGERKKSWRVSKFPVY